MTPPSDDALAEVDRVFERFAAGDTIPGVVYGVVVDGRLIAHRGFGTVRVGAAIAPDLDSVFRIASMTKSFTAAAILRLRDDGVLRLDDTAARWVDDAPREVTVEQLLTMSSGLPTDDPWGDRQQGLDLADFAALLRAGLREAWTPGTRFEYSNLGYGILGRVVTAASGLEYRDYVQRHLLTPLGMDATTFELASVSADRRVSGYVRRDDEWTEEPIDGYGALASMGGVFTSIRDLARWVAGFTDAFAPLGTEEMTHPLTRVSRRAMQQVHRSIDPEIEWASVAARPALVAGGYGYGLFAFDDPTIGRTVGHGGGYPGFGSHMRWHPGSGIGVLAFGNARYARMGVPVVDALRRLATGEIGRRRAVTPWPETVAARAGVERLLEGWDDSLAAGLFSMNVELDEPLERRRTAIERLRSVHGALRPDPSEEPSSDAPSHLGWWMRGERGRVFIDILLDPQVPPRVQSIDLTSVPEPPEPLAAIASRLAALCSSPAPDWPADIPTVATLDLPEITRELRATAALYGPLSVGAAVNGDGRSTARWRLISARGALDLELKLDDSSGDLISVVFQPRKIRVPIHET